MQNVVSDTGFSLIDSIGKDSIIHQGVEILVENPQGGRTGDIYRLILGDMVANPGRIIKYRGQSPNRPVFRMISGLLKRLRRLMPVTRDMSITHTKTLRFVGREKFIGSHD